jgi:hypothetical protein
MWSLSTNHYSVSCIDSKNITLRDGKYLASIIPSESSVSTDISGSNVGSASGSERRISINFIIMRSYDGGEISGDTMFSSSEDDIIIS